MKASGLGIPAVDMLLVHLPYYIRFIAVYSKILGIFDIRGLGRLGGVDGEVGNSCRSILKPKRPEDGEHSPGA